MVRLEGEFCTGKDLPVYLLYRTVSRGKIPGEQPQRDRCVELVTCAFPLVHRYGIGLLLGNLLRLSFIHSGIHRIHQR